MTTKTRSKPQPAPAPRVLTIADYRKRLDHAQDYVLRRLNNRVEEGRVGVVKLQEKLAEGGAGDLAYRVSWADGVQEDQMALWAKLLLMQVHGGQPLLEALKAHLAETERNLLRNGFTQNSTNPFHNAVESMKAECAARWREELRNHIREIEEPIEDAAYLELCGGK